MSQSKFEIPHSECFHSYLKLLLEIVGTQFFRRCVHEEVVPVVVILVFLLGGCFSFGDMLDRIWEGVITDAYGNYDTVLVINSNNTGSISFDNDSYSVNIVNRRANRSSVGEYGWYDSYWRERIIQAELVNYG